MTTPEHVRNTHWDFVVIGTGIGGGTVGYELAKSGKKVLFLDKGRNYLNHDSDLIQGEYAEHFFPANSYSNSPVRENILKRALRYSGKIRDASSKHPYSFHPLIGEGSGGSSALYGMVLERFFPEDLDIGSYFGAESGANLPKRWPIRYGDLRPNYAAAEKLYRVRGTLDPLRANQLDPLIPPPPLSAPSRELFDAFEERGLHPYSMPMACEYVPGCIECIGAVCPKDCKNDSARICLRPAIEKYGAVLLSECEVVRLHTDAARVTKISCKYKGNEFNITGDQVVLAAGTLHSPAILLRSASERWPNGLANDSGQVGKNLMRHFFDLYCVKTQATVGDGSLIKQIALNDAYIVDGQKLGTVQAVGKIPNASALAEELWEEMARKGHPGVAQLLKLARPFVGLFAERMISRRLILTAIMEDLPYEYNRVTLPSSGEGIEIHYRINNYEKARIREFRKQVNKILRGQRFTFINNAENNERMAHACGTLRFGNDPTSSVLDSNNRAHGVENLYVVDASFFPTGSGINPSLTLAANAIRVARHLLANIPHSGAS